MKAVIATDSISLGARKMLLTFECPPDILINRSPPVHEATGGQGHGSFLIGGFFLYPFLIGLLVSPCIALVFGISSCKIVPPVKLGTRAEIQIIMIRRIEPPVYGRFARNISRSGRQTMRHIGIVWIIYARM